MSLLPMADGYADTTACPAQTGGSSAAELVVQIPLEGHSPTYDAGPVSEEGQTRPVTPSVDYERVTTAHCAFGSPAWCFFGVPGGSPNIQRELVVTCKLCRAQVRRGINPGKVGTTCLLTHLERRHGMTRQEVYEKAVTLGYCGPKPMFAALSSDCAGGRRAASKRSGAFISSSDDDDEDESVRQTTTAPATSSGPPAATSSSLSDRQNQSRPRSSAYRQALRDRLLGSMHLFCEVCHALVLSGERSQSGRDLALETHFSTNHPQMFKLLKSGAARDVRLGGLCPSSSLPSSVQR